MKEAETLRLKWSGQSGAFTCLQKLYIAHARTRASRNRPLSSNHRQGNVEISLFSQKSKNCLCSRSTQTHSVWEGRCYQGNVWNRDFSICGFWGYLRACVCFCATSCRLHTNSASGSCRKFFTCFLIEPHLAQAQTHIWTHRLEKISKPATHRDCGSQRNF